MASGGAAEGLDSRARGAGNTREAMVEQGVAADQALWMKEAQGRRCLASYA